MQSVSSLQILFWQGVDEIDPDVLKYGGMKVTGFRIVDINHQTVRNFPHGHITGDQEGQNGREGIDPTLWPGARHRNISVS